MKHSIEFIEDGHIYLVDGIITPSVTQILKVRFGNMYDHVSPSVLRQAAERGTNIHKAIQQYCESGEDDGSKEVHNFQFLADWYKFIPLENEQMIVLEDEGKPIAVGTLDLLVERCGGLWIGDIKSTSKLNKDYLFYQLNLYAKGYEQTHGQTIDGLFGIHLRENTRRFVEIPKDWDMAKEVINEYKERQQRVCPIDSDYPVG